jgi:hypothetical protein
MPVGCGEAEVGKAIGRPIWNKYCVELLKLGLSQISNSSALLPFLMVPWISWALRKNEIIRAKTKNHIFFIAIIFKPQRFVGASGLVSNQFYA